MHWRKFCTRFGVMLLVLLGMAWAAVAAPGLYVVELEGAPAIRRAAEETRAARGGFSARAGRGWAKYAAAVRAEQDTHRFHVEARGARVLGSVSLAANALIVEMEDGEAPSLEAIPGVKSVHRAREYKMTMNAALPLHKVREAWDLAGGESHAGEGVKIAILDSGIEASHPAFQDPEMTAPEGFPRFNDSRHAAFTSGKIIVARSYVDYLNYYDPDRSPADHVGHGTAVAMIAAGVVHEGPMGWVSGVAPKAWIGVYKVFGTPGYNDTTTDAALLKAIDDAIADGMDVLNLSLGSNIGLRLEEDVLAQALENAAGAGLVVVVAAGNNGPGWGTIASPATAPSALSVGASTNSRTFGSSVSFEGHDTVVAVPGNGPTPTGRVSGEVADVAMLDGGGLACDSLPQGSLTGKIALILRGDCTFQVKLTNAKNAGAAGALVQAREDSPDPITMAVGNADLPAMMISFDSGQSVRQWLADSGTVLATMDFTYGPVPQKAGRLAGFSARGPNVDLAIKPELMATGTDMWIATQSINPFGDMWSDTGYTLVDGTSFSAPFVAGAAAVVKAARPGFDVAAVRSALVNTAAAVLDGDGAWMQKGGAGILDVEAAVRTPLVSSVAALSFGAAAPGGAVEARSFQVKQATDAPETYFVRVEPRRGEAVPAVSTGQLELAPGQEVEIRVEWPAPAQDTGTMEGFIVLEAASSGATLRIPYWLAVTRGEPSQISVLDAITSARRGRTVRDALLFRVVDASGAPVSGAHVTVEELDSGIALGVTDYNAYSPGLYGLTVRLSFLTGANRFRVRAGNAEYLFTITGY